MALKVGSDLDFQSVSRITNLPAPAADNDPVRQSDLNAAIDGLDPKNEARVATSSNINLASPGATLDGETMVANDRVLVRGQTNTEENGLYVWVGASGAMTRTTDANTATELEGAVVGVKEGTDAGGTFRQTSVNFTLDTDPVVWVSFGGSVPDASTTVKGKVELATQTEVNTGTDSERVITCETLANWDGRYQAFTALIGDGSATQYDVTHSLGTRAVHVQVVEEASPYDFVIVETKAQTTSAVRLNFAGAPSSNEFRVLISKVG